MTPKEKALELHNKIADVWPTQNFIHNNSKICAIICVDQIIENDYGSHHNIEYWSLVKQELERL